MPRFFLLYDNTPIIQNKIFFTKAFINAMYFIKKATSEEIALFDQLTIVNYDAIPPPLTEILNEYASDDVWTTPSIPTIPTWNVAFTEDVTV